VLKALGSRTSSVTTRDSGCDNRAVIHIHVDRSTKCVL
jgi:hypothetical protein